MTIPGVSANAIMCQYHGVRGESLPVSHCPSRCYSTCYKIEVLLVDCLREREVFVCVCLCVSICVCDSNVCPRDQAVLLRLWVSEKFIRMCVCA